MQRTTLVARLAGANTKAADFNAARHEFALGGEFTLENGVLDNQADLVHAVRITLAASATQNIDLNGVIIDALGAAANFARLVGIGVQADDGNTNDVIIGGAGANGFVGFFGSNAHTLAVRPGGVFMLYAPKGTGYPVVAGTGDLLRVANSGAGTSVSFSLVLLGKSS